MFQGSLQNAVGVIARPKMIVKHASSKENTIMSKASFKTPQGSLQNEISLHEVSENLKVEWNHRDFPGELSFQRQQQGSPQNAAGVMPRPKALAKHVILHEITDISRVNFKRPQGPPPSTAGVIPILRLHVKHLFAWDFWNFQGEPKTPQCSIQNAARITPMSEMLVNKTN